MISLNRTMQIFWAFGRRNLFARLYLDVYRTKIRSRSCACEDDIRLIDRAKRLTGALQDLGPIFIKLGQILAQQGDVFPPAYVGELRKLQDHARPVPTEQIRRHLESVCVCERSSGVHDPLPLCLHCRKIDTVFERFDAKPFAVASLAQVHRAKFKGEEVAVKILKPGVIDILNRDLAILYQFRKSLVRSVGLSLAVDPDEFHSELQRSLRSEVDLQAEGLHMDAFRENTTVGINVPKVYWGFLRDDILVMEFIEGVPLDKATTSSKTSRSALATRLASNFLEQIFVHNLFHADPHPGNLLLRQDEIVFIDFGVVSRLDPRVQRHLRRLIAELSNNDVPEAAQAFLDLCGQPAEALAAMPGLLVDIGLIAQGFRNGPGMRWSDRIVDIARQYGLKMPRSVISLAKALMLIEGVALKLDPEFQLQNAILKFKKEAVSGELMRRFAETEDAITSYGELAADAPTLIRKFFEDASRHFAPSSGAAYRK